MIQISIILMSSGKEVVVRMGEDIRVHATRKEINMQAEIFAMVSKYLDMVDKRDKAELSGKAGEVTP